MDVVIRLEKGVNIPVALIKALALVAIVMAGIAFVMSYDSRITADSMERWGKPTSQIETLPENTSNIPAEKLTHVYKWKIEFSANDSGDFNRLRYSAAHPDDFVWLSSTNYPSVILTDNPVPDPKFFK